MKKKLSRRDFMQALTAVTAGSTLSQSLPIFRTIAQAQAAPTRLLLVAKTHGWMSDKKFGNGYFGVNSSSPFGFDLPPSHTDLYDIAEHVTLVDGLRGTHWGNAHDVSYSDIFTSAVPAGETSSDINIHFPRPTGPSLDWVLGDILGKNVLRVSNDYRSWGELFHPLCFDGSAQLLGFTRDLDTLYDSVAGVILNAQNPSSGSALETALNQELFKLSGNSIDRIARLLRGGQKQKLENFKSTLNRVNSSLSIDGINTDVVVPARPEGWSLQQDFTSKSLDLIKLAFMADTHRISVLGLNGQLTDFPWTDSSGQAQNGNIWSDGFHHAIAHYTGHAPDSPLALDANNKEYVKLIVDFAKDLDATIDVDGRTMLENTMIVLTGEVGSGSHDTRTKPVVIIGGRGSAGLNTGRLISPRKIIPKNVGDEGITFGRPNISGDLLPEFPCMMHRYYERSKQTEADLMVSIARAMGHNISSFGLPVTNTVPIQLT
ncbi:MAG: DUF1552 domain-containing protein [Bdellovibrionales bacterium]